MIVNKNGLIKILARQYKQYTVKQIVEIVERDGASSFDSNIEYLGFGQWKI